MQRGAGTRTTALGGVAAGCAHLGFWRRFAHSVYWRNTISQRRETQRPQSTTLTNVAVFERRESRIGNRTRPYRVRPARQELPGGRRGVKNSIEHIETAEKLANPMN